MLSIPAIRRTMHAKCHMVVQIVVHGGTVRRTEVQEHFLKVESVWILVMVIILMAREKWGIKLFSDRTCKQRERFGLKFHYF